MILLKNTERRILMSNLAFPQNSDKAYKAFNIELKLNEQQLETLRHNFDASRWAWNSLLALNKYLYTDFLKNHDPEKFNELVENAKVKKYAQQQLDFYNNFLKNASNKEILEIAQPIINTQLQRNLKKDKNAGVKYLSNFDMKKIITQARKYYKDDPNHPLHFKDIAVTVPRTATSDLDLAWQAFWRNLKTNPEKAGQPKFKSRFQRNQCGFTEGVKPNAFSNKKHQRFISIPKLGKVAYHHKRHTPAGQVKTLRIYETPTGRIMMAVTIKQDTSTPMNLKKIQPQQMIGINLNYSDNVITLSNGKTYTPDWDRLEYLQSRIDYWSKHLDMRKNRYEEHYAKLKNKLTKEKQLDQLPEHNPYSVRGVREARHARAKAHQKLANTRKYWFTQIVTKLTRQYRVIYTPKYNVTKIKQTTKYGKHKLDLIGLGMFNQMLHTQSRKNGCLIIEVNPAYATQKCHECGQVDIQHFGTTKHPKKYTKPTWECPNCHAHNQLHVNAAINTMKEGLEDFDKLASQQAEKFDENN